MLNQLKTNRWSRKSGTKHWIQHQAVRVVATERAELSPLCRHPGWQGTGLLESTPADSTRHNTLKMFHHLHLQWYRLNSWVDVRNGLLHIFFFFFFFTCYTTLGTLNRGHRNSISGALFEHITPAIRQKDRADKQTKIEKIIWKWTSLKINLAPLVDCTLCVPAFTVRVGG